jgi:hypothetical protein
MKMVRPLLDFLFDPSQPQGSTRREYLRWFESQHRQPRCHQFKGVAGAKSCIFLLGLEGPPARNAIGHHLGAG